VNSPTASKVGSTYYKASNFHLDKIESWLRRAYPISNLSVVRSTYDYPSSGLPNVNSLHLRLALLKAYRVVFSGESVKTIYYGLVDDGGGFMRGNAMGIPGTIAAGPTGLGTFGWDTDGSYGDWYTGHEIGHTRGRYHAEFCGAGGGKSYPYPNGRISPSITGNTAIYGFDISTRAIYPPSWSDVMTYCSNQWISDFTYEGIRSHIISVGLLESNRIMAEQVLLITGLANLDEGTAELEDVQLLNLEAELEMPAPGEWEIALINESNADLKVIPFNPLVLSDDEEDPAEMGIISEIIPYQPGTIKVAIRYQGKTVAERSASANAPVVEVTEPKRGGQYRADINISWNGSDPDGDPLTFNILFSNDGGKTWEVLASGLEEENLVVNREDLPGGENSLIKVIASDGFYTGEGESGPFTVFPHGPMAQIDNPGEGQIFHLDQNLVLQGSAYDMEDGTIEADLAFIWTSNLDGELGSGRNLNTTELSEGDHQITLSVTDSHGNKGFAMRTVKVVAADAPKLTLLEIAPFSVGIVVEVGVPSAAHLLTVRTSSDEPVNWMVTGGAAWVSIDAANGVSPNDLELTFNTAGLAVGKYETLLIFTSADALNGTVEVPVVLHVIPLNMRDLFLPLVGR
jgi:hypothetical protein